MLNAEHLGHLYPLPNNRQKLFPSRNQPNDGAYKADKSDKARDGRKSLRKSTRQARQQSPAISTPDGIKRNPWNNFLKENRGKYRGKRWQEKAVEDYRMQNQK